MSQIVFMTEDEAKWRNLFSMLVSQVEANEVLKGTDTLVFKNMGKDTVSVLWRPSHAGIRGMRANLILVDKLWESNRELVKYLHYSTFPHGQVVYCL